MLDQIIDEVATAHQPAPIARTATLTVKGHAAVAGLRFVRALRELDPVDRAEVLATFAPELRSVIADLAHGA